MAAVGSALPVFSQKTSLAADAPDYSMAIEMCSFEVAKGKFLKTISYNQQIPGPVLRLTQGRPVTINVMNRTTRPEIVHWHGLGLPPQVDGAMEEGTPMISPGATTRFAFTPQQAGLRWYHTHTAADSDLQIAQYSGQHGLMLIDPATRPLQHYDKEFSLVLHDWDGQFQGADDGTMQPVYNHSTINARVEEFNEPLRVKTGDRVLFQILNASATDVHWLSFSGHAFDVTALDGNDLASSRRVDMLRLAPAERITAVVDMNNPGRWVCAEPRKHVREAGMGIVVEYEGASGMPRFDQPSNLVWDYSVFSGNAPAAPGTVPTVLPIVIESKFMGHGSPERWLLNGRSYPDTTVPPLLAGKRYRLRFDNRSMDDHPLHLHRHLFRITSIAGKRMNGPLKDTVLVPSKTVTEVDFTADNPGSTLLHCHQQDHMDRGFMMVLHYA
jgi:FtsP/CotA-like multicopper oxidase with cupredoxin domain